MQENTTKKYEKFIEEIKKFKYKQTKQKQRGLNDYNILTTVLKPHDEVRLHSRMIGSFLDINGNHYQDSLFLEKFIEVIGLKNYKVEKSKIYLEYENIDLYLTDGNKHIIIENKVYAEDQNKQIKRYIETIKMENKELSWENLYVYYLSIDRKVPSKVSLGDLNIEDNIIFNKKYKIAQYKAIYYKKHILSWLEKCQYEVQNITNLNEAIKQYINAIKIMLGDYKSHIEKFQEFFTIQENYVNFEKYNHKLKELDIYEELLREFKKAKKKLYNNFYEKVLLPILNENNLQFKEYYENSEVGRKKDGDIIFLKLSDIYDIRLYIKNNIFVNISVSLNKNLNFNNDDIKKFEKKLQNSKYKTGKKKGEKLNCNIKVLPPTIQNLFFAQINNIEKINDYIIQEIEYHIKNIKKDLL